MIAKEYKLVTTLFGKILEDEGELKD